MFRPRDGSGGQPSHGWEWVGLWNRLIHGYDAVDLDILWDIVRDDLPPLIDRLRQILGEQRGQAPC